MAALALLPSFACAFSGSSSILYVALDGSDSASGSEGNPFRTLQHCAAVAPAGSTCLLADGRYDRTEDQAPIVIERDLTIAGEVTAVLDGSIELSTTWTRGDTNTCIYTSGTLDMEVWQLLAASTSASGGFIPIAPARFPNAKMSDDSVFDGAPYSLSGRRNGSLLYSNKESSSGKIVDDGSHTPSMASCGLDFTGAIAVLPLGTMGTLTQGVRVKQHRPGSASFSYNPPAGTAGKAAPVAFERSQQVRLLAGAQHALDPTRGRATSTFPSSSRARVACSTPRVSGASRGAVPAGG